MESINQSIDLLSLFPGKLQSLQDQNNEAMSTLQEQKQLIVQLEEDLRSVNALSVMFRGDAEVRDFVVGVLESVRIGRKELFLKAKILQNGQLVYFDRTLIWCFLLAVCRHCFAIDRSSNVFVRRGSASLRPIRVQKSWPASSVRPAEHVSLVVL